MRWTPGGISSDIEDRRGGGGFGGFSFGGGPVGCGGIILLLVLSLLFGRNFFSLLGPSEQAPRQATTTAEGGPAMGPGSAPVAESPEEHKEMQFVSFVLDDVQKTWDTILPEQARVEYQHAKLVPFRDATQSGCGFAQAASGPFYCPTDGRVYLDLAFFDELKQRFGAPGDFAQAYVLAHEIGHRVQDVLGISDKIHRAQENDPQRANEYSVRLELQADCFAGIWGHTTEQRNILDPGDVDEGLAAAAAVGDDRIQRMAGRRVSPESWTHGSSEERASWFRRGFQSGRISDCDTFR